MLPPPQEESDQVKKARRKLEDQMTREDAQMTPKAVQEMSRRIKEWIDRYSEQRVSLAEKQFALFDENENAAKPTPAVEKLRGQLMQDLFEQNNHEIRGLKGRISPESPSKPPKTDSGHQKTES